MAKEFRYSLTRICLRTGQLSLSNRMAQLFPDSGSVIVHDTAQGTDLELTATAPRLVAGVGEFIEKHDLGVNDTILIRETEEGRITFTPQRRKRQAPIFDRDALVYHLLDELGSGGPRSEEEIRAQDSRIPPDFPLNDLLESHPRFQMRAGRWQVLEDFEASAASRPGQADPARQPEATIGSVPADDATPAKTGDSNVDDRAPNDDTLKGEALTGEARKGEALPGEALTGEALNDEAPIDDSIWPDSLARPKSSESADEYEPLLEARRGGSSAAGDEAERVSVTPYPRNVMFPGDAALNSKREAVDLAASKRAREALSDFGYRVEGLPHGLLLARADLGRRQQVILIRALADNEKLDWAALLAARREHEAPYLAVMGDHRDLHRLSAPAELARATLWSWDGIERARNLAATVPLGPFDLEPHFESGGLFGPGLEEFERRVGQMIEERGRISALLAELARFPTPSVFMLDDLAGGELRRDQLAGMLESLNGPPFHLVSRVDKGEYCLRQSVDSALLQVSEYALSLRERLNKGGSDDPATTTEADAPRASARVRRR